MNPIELAQVGNTNVRVTRLGLGGTPLGGLYYDVCEEAAIATVRRAAELGLNFFDTAPLYGSGKSELRVGKALAGMSRSSFVLATKVGYSLVPAAQGPEDIFFPFDNAPPLRPVFDFSYDSVMRSLEESLNRLNLDHVDILHIHDPDLHYEEAMEGAYRALDDLRRSGAVGAIGVGMNQADMLERFARDGDFDCVLLAGRYTLIDHTGLKELFPTCVRRGISLIIGGPFNSGILATGARPGAMFNYVAAPQDVLEKVRQIESVCESHTVPLKAAALQFPLGHAAVISVVPGARSVAEVEENFSLMSYPIPAAFWEELRERKLLPAEAPISRPQALQDKRHLSF